MHMGGLRARVSTILHNLFTPALSSPLGGTLLGTRYAVGPLVISTYSSYSSPSMEE